ncbi:MAG TPA: hypothetical protein VGK46_01190 [Saprospiraceae bacterium]
MKAYDHLKKNLRNYSVEVDKEKLWQQTMHAIPKKKKRTAAPLLLLLGILLLSGSLAYNTFKSSFTNPGFNLAINPTNPENSIAANHDLQTFTSDSDQFKLNQPPSANVNPLAQIPGNHVEDQFKQNHSSPKKLMNSNYKPGNNAHQALFVKNDNSAIAFGDVVQTNLEELNNGVEAIVSTEKRDADTWYAELIEPLALKSLPVLYKNPLSSKHYSIKPAALHPKNIFSISLMQGFGISSLSFDPHDEQAKEMRDFISTSTRSLESFTTSVRGRLDLDKGISISAGIGYGHLTTETIYQFTRTDRSDHEGTSSIIIDETGHQFLVSGNVGSTRYIDLEATRYTHHQSLAFELLLHKTLFKIKRAIINGYLKGGMNAWYSAEGTAFTPEKVPVQFSVSENPYRLNSPWLFGFGLDIQYRMTPKWVLSGALGYGRKDIYHLDYQQLKWKHSIYSLSLGVGYVL